MDFETFTNSALLLQGKADEFSNRTPADRKAVLAKIIGLEEYDLLQTRARDRLDQARTKAAGMEGSLGQMRSQVEQIGDLSQELAAVDEELSGLASQLAEQQQQTGELRAKVAELDGRRQRLEESEHRIHTLTRETTQLELALAQAVERAAGYKELLSQEETIRQGMADLELARQRFETLEGLRRSYDELNQEKAQFVRAVDGARARLEAQAEQLRPQGGSGVARPRRRWPPRWPSIRLLPGKG